MRAAVDPVTGFEIPRSWMDLCRDPHLLEKIESGLWVILADGRLLRRGLTTGTTAATACKGAILSLRQPKEAVEVPTPAGIRVTIPVKAQSGLCVATKDGGDHQFDVTHGIEIHALASPSEEIELVAGKGVGRITSPGLCASPGKLAISQSARRQIMDAISEGLEETGLKAARVEVFIPAGETLAKETLNPQLGIEGGISILGSTGFVEPWNEHLAQSRGLELTGDRVVATTGRTGLKFSRMLFPEHKAVLIGSRFDILNFREGQESVLCGLPALILKWAWPAVLEGTGCRTVAELVERDPRHKNIDLAIKEAKKRLPHTRIVLLYKDGRIFRDIL